MANEIDQRPERVDYAREIRRGPEIDHRPINTLISRVL